jgi:acyl transferase domain-containing protein/aryl carrier-like protein
MSVEQEMRELLKASLTKVKELKAQLTAVEGAQSEPIAVIGIGCRFPGGAHSPEAFWQLLDEGRDAVQPLASRWELLGASPSEDVPRWAGLLTAPVDSFDAAFFGISPREAQPLDPQQRLVLEIAWEALEHAGVPPHSLQGSRTGVFLGECGADYAEVAARQPRELRDAYSTTGLLPSLAAGRVSYTLGFQGPCLTIDTACSSSLVSIHLACQSLRARESDLALAGGVNLLLSAENMEGAARTQALAPDGRCKTFDASANGYVRGEGCGLVVLKRLSDARRDGDTIWAVIRGSAVNQDGRSTGLTAPNVLAQQALLREALQQAHVAPGDIGYVETHGTGTSLGDPIEVEALRAVLGAPRADGGHCWLGAVKTNLGHLEGAAGVAGLIKTVLALHHERIPKNLHFKTLNPRLRVDGTALALATDPLSWPRGPSPRFAGVSSFGLSGTNAHVVLEEAPERERAAAAPERSAELLVLSAKSPEALDGAAARLCEHLDAHPSLGLGDVAFSLATTREHLPHRLSVAASGRETLREALEAAAQGQSPAGSARGCADGGLPKVVFVFPGQGGQWLGMGRQLLAEEPAFRASIEASDRAIQSEAGWSLLAELAAEPSASQLARINVVQPVLFAVEIALAALWRSWGVTPDAVVGHSMGEVAAAHVAGALSLEDAVAVICRRSGLLRRISGQGEMAMVELSVAEAEAAIAGREDRLSVAVSNSPRSTVLAGDPAALAEVMAALEERGVFCRRVKVDVASHSPQVDPLRAELSTALRGLAPQRATVPMRSTVTLATIEGQELGAAYWADNLRQPVRFAQAVQALLAEGHGLFVEMSPHPVLTPAVEEMRRASGQKGAAVGSQRREQPERAALLESLGALYVHGWATAWERLFPAGGRRVALPNYAWQRERHWIEAPAGDLQRSRGRAHAGGHPLLGEAQTVSTRAGLHLWATALDQQRLPWLGDHRVQGAVVLPGAAYLEMALAAGAVAFKGAPVAVTGVSFVETLTFTDSTPVEVQVVTEESSGQQRFQIASRAPGEGDTPWTTHARGTLSRAEGAEPDSNLDLASVRGRLGEAEPAGGGYAALSEMGLDYGPAFQGLVERWQHAGEALGRVRLPESAGSAAEYQIHPALLDACFQALAGLVRGSVKETWVPVEVGSLRLLQRPTGEVWCHARMAPGAPGHENRRSADLRVVDAHGAPIAEITGLVVQRLLNSERQREQDEWFLEIAWEPAPAPAPAIKAGRFLLLGDGGGLGVALRAALAAADHAVVQAVAGAPGAVPAGCLPVDDTSAAGVRALLADAFGGQAPSAVVHLRSLEGTRGLDAEALEAAFARGYDSALHTVQALTGMGYQDAPRLWLVTRGAQAVGDGDIAVEQAPLVGLGRTIAMEHPELRCSRIDLDPARPDREIRALLAELLVLESEQEIALRGGERRVARLVRRLPEAEQRERIEPAGGRPFRLTIDRPGVLDDLVLRVAERRAPGPGEVEIAVEAAGLNFIDVMKAMAIYPGTGDGPPALGGECAGRIVAVGEGSHGFVVGQDVLAVMTGSFSSHITVGARHVALRPSGLTTAQAAAAPLVFATAWYALVHLGRLRAGERVLIHSATGGTGLAAVQIARHLGAEIFATAGSPSKRAWLREQGIAHVMDSRSLSFAEEVLAATGGQGVDVVLNSLSGNAIEASLSALGQDGRFLELGNTDIYADRPLGLAHFKKSLSYSAVDLAGMTERRPERFAALLHEVVELLATGTLAPLPVETFPMARAAEAFRKMAQAQHLGKLVLTVDPEVDVHVPIASRVVIRRSGSYLVTGGLGGLGLSVAGWLAAQGAGQVVLLGRGGAASPEQQAAISAIEARGTRVTVARADVAIRSQIEPVLAEIAASKMPLSGVVHAAGVLDDGLLSQQTPARFRRVMAPKILGALHLHELTRGLPLDFFVLYSSAAAIFGSPGQGNYAAANTFLDAHAHQRRAEGLPALSIDWGAFSGVGLAAAEDGRGARLESRGMRSLTPDEGLVALQRLLGGSRAQVGVAPFDARRWVESYPSAASSSMLSRLLAEQPGGALQEARELGLLARIAGAAPGARTSLLQEAVRAEVARVLRVPESKLDVSAPLIRLGLDSLMGLELKHRLKRATTVDVPVARLLDNMSIADLARYLNDRVPLPSDAPAETPNNSTWLDTEL